MNLLNKYEKKIPTTWNELLETAIYIKDKEKQLHNRDIIGYNGLFEGKYFIKLLITFKFFFSFFINI